MKSSSFKSSAPQKHAGIEQATAHVFVRRDITQTDHHILRACSIMLRN